MQVDEIQQGRRYTDNRGNVREVLALEAGQPVKGPRSRLQYRLLVKRRSSHTIGSTHSTTIHCFAEWARREVR